jgi:hypothetical protein
MQSPNTIYKTMLDLMEFLGFKKSNEKMLKWMEIFISNGLLKHVNANESKNRIEEEIIIKDLMKDFQFVIPWNSGSENDNKISNWRLSSLSYKRNFILANILLDIFKDSPDSWIDVEGYLDLLDYITENFSSHFNNINALKLHKLYAKAKSKK